MDKNEEINYLEPKITNGEIASGAVIKKDNKYLLVQEAKENIRGLWNLPAGRVEKGVTIEENAVKEVREETGYKVKIIKKIGIFHKDGERGVKHAYEAEIIGGELKFPKDEILDVKWFTLDEIRKMKDKLRNSWVIEAIETLEGQKDSTQYLDAWKRCQADFENYKKAQTKHQEEFRKYAKIDVIEQILPVVDNFEASLAHVPADENENKWVEGIVYIKRQLEDVLKNNGIEEIPAKAGDMFDPEIHEAVGGDGRKQEIVKVLQKGYRLNGRVLRATRVEVG